MTNNLRISKEKLSVRLDAQAIALAGSIGFGKFLGVPSRQPNGQRAQLTGY